MQELNQTDHNTTDGLAKEFYKSGQLKSQSIVIRNVHIFSVMYDEAGNIIRTWEVSEKDSGYIVVSEKVPEYKRRYKLE
nr:hypothetical protein [Lysinibacillus timonensis]